MAQLQILQPHLNHADHSQLKDVIYMAKGGSGYTQGLPDSAGGLFFTVYQDPNTNHTSGSETRASGSQYYLNTDGIVWSRTGYNLGYQGGLGGGRYRTTWHEWKQITLKGINDIQIENKLRNMQDELDEVKNKQFDMVYQHINDSELTGSGIDSYNKLGSQKTHNITGIPNNHGDGYGTIFYIPEHKDAMNHKGFQFYNSTTYKTIYYRTSDQEGRWQEWHRIATGTDAILKSEAQSKFTGDLNNITNSGILQVGGEEGHRPIPSSEGVVETYKGYNGRLIQRWTGISENNSEGRVFTRIKNNRGWSNWKEVASKEDVTFKHYTTRVEHIKNLVHSGYYHTTELTQDLPEQVMKDNDSKTGILLIIKKDTKIHYEYTPIQGKFKNHMFIGDFDTITRAGEKINWTKVAGAEGHIKVHDTRSQPDVKPEEYYKHTDYATTGYIVYQWKWANDLGLTNELGTDNDDILLMTIIPVSKEEKEYEGLINQKAYDLKSHKTYVRNSTYNKGSKNWNQWSKWQELAGGGQPQPPTPTIKADLKQPLIDMFNKWKERCTQKP